MTRAQHIVPSGIVALLGIMQSGGVAVIVDPELPRRRRAHMITESKTRFALIAQGRLPRKTGAEAIDIDMTTGVAASLSPADAPAAFELQPDDPAYIFFTSGSTGTPRAW